MAQVVFIHDTDNLAAPLGSMQAILDWSAANPGRFTYPQSPDFLGTTFLKQALVDLLDDPSALTVMGPSGVGKSTLLALITGTLSSDFRAEGEVWLDGRNIAQVPLYQRRVGILFQDDHLFPHLSVGANLAVGLRPGGTKSERQAQIAMALEDVGLGGFADRDPANLSGGQKARVAPMRMLLSEPCALLLDEPFAKLDAALREQVRTLVFARAKARELPVLTVTHDAADAQAAGGAIITL